MTSSFQRAVNGVYGAYRLFRLDPRGMDFFEPTAAGFRHSFLTVLATLPFHLITMQVPGPAEAAEAAPWTLGRLIVEAVDYVMPWLVFPFFAFALTRLFGLTRNYYPYIIAWNWSAVPAAALGALVTLLAYGAFGADAVGIAFLVLMIYLIYVEWFLTRVALQTTTAIAATIVAVEIVVLLLLSQAIALLR